MTIDMSQFFQVFFDEAEEGLAEIEKLLLAVNVSDPDDEDLNAIFRAAHSIKGGSSTFGLTDIAEVTHVLESLLDRVRQGQMALTSQHVDAFLAAKDVLKSMLDGHRHGTAVDLDAVGDVRMLLQSLSEGATGKNAANSSKKSAEKVLSRYRVELPKLDERDIDALEQELGLIGTVQKTIAADGSCTFIVDSDKGSESIIAMVSLRRLCRRMRPTKNAVMAFSNRLSLSMPMIVSAVTVFSSRLFPSILSKQSVPVRRQLKQKMRTRCP